MSDQNLENNQEETVINPQDTASGRLRVEVRSALGMLPIQNASVQVTFTADPTSRVWNLTTNEPGQTETISLPAPPRAYSEQPDEPTPYAQYTVLVTAPGYERVDISGIEVFPGETAVLPVRLQSTSTSENEEQNIVIPANTLYGDYPPKIPEAEIKPTGESGEIVLSRVVIPQYIIVHDGPPSDSSAMNYYVPYKDYIKNVASSEIYSTWPDAAIRANILAIMSFTLNRVYTEWYRNKGYDFTITSSTAYDHKWVYGRNIYENISQIVDEMFTNYLSRPNVKQPILTQYCDGKQVSCPDWMTQWGSKYLADQNYSAIEILRNYYGDDIYINTAEEISGIPLSWPGENLEIGSTGSKVRQIQEELAAISEHYPAIPRVAADGIYGEATAEAVRVFQSVFGLPQTGIIDFATWYRISEVYVGVTRIAELN